MQGLYVHIPFCVKKCSYCDFYSLPSRQDAIASYIQAVLKEAKKYTCHSDVTKYQKNLVPNVLLSGANASRSSSSFQTLYIGGGTPSLLGAKHLTTLIIGLAKTFDLSSIDSNHHCDPSAEHVGSGLEPDRPTQSRQKQNEETSLPLRPQASGGTLQSKCAGIHTPNSLIRHCDPSAAISGQGGNPNSLVGSGLRRYSVSKLMYEPDRPKNGSLSLGLLESTIEVNPESASPEFLQTAKNLGFNRVSFGVQSLSNDELKSVGRIHSAAQAIAAIKLTQNLKFKAISADLIIGLPGQTWISLRKSLETLVGMGIQHLSVYCLSLEAGTVLANNPPADLPSDDLQASMFEETKKYLNRCGYAHYEISNFALPGFACLHNLNYWHGGEYLGLGPAAASHLDGKRFKNKANLDAYLTDPTGQIEYIEELSAKDKAAEEAMLRLRLLEEGLNTEELANKFGEENVKAIIRRLEEMAPEGLLIKAGSRCRLEPSRILTSNPIFTRVLGDKE